MQEEYFFQCPYCAQEISILLDISVPEQVYVEDCEVCCRPIQVSYGAKNETVDWFEANRLE